MSRHIDSPTLLDRLGRGRLPVLPANTPVLLRALSNEQLDFREIAAVIEQFPTLAGRLIALANSAWSSPAETILSVEQACARLGLSVVRSSSLALAVAAAFDPSRCPAFDAERYWTDALLCAEASSRICAASPLSERLEPAAARAGGLLHNLGVLWIADRLPDEFAEAVERQEKADHRLSLHEALRERLGFDQADAGGLLALKWKLPEDLEAAMALTGEYREAQRRPMEWIVGYAIRQVGMFRARAECSKDDPRIALIGLEDDACTTLQQELDRQGERLRELARTLFG